MYGRNVAIAPIDIERATSLPQWYWTLHRTVRSCGQFVCPWSVVVISTQSSDLNETVGAVSREVNDPVLRTSVAFFPSFGSNPIRNRLIVLASEVRCYSDKYYSPDIVFSVKYNFGNSSCWTQITSEYIANWHFN